MNPLITQIDLGGVWRSTLFFGLLFSSVIFVLRNIDKIGMTASALWIYALGYALYLIEYPAMHFGEYNTAYQATAGQSLAAMALIPVLALAAGRRTWAAVPFFVLINCALIWMNPKWGFLRWETFDSSLIALSLPFLPAYMVYIALVTIAFKGGTTSALIVGTWIFSIFVRSWKRFFIFSAGCLAAIPFLSEKVMDSQGRMTVYERMMGIWSSNPKSIIFGVGPGSFMWQSIGVGDPNSLFLSMHSDWLQVTFELGLIGLVLSLAVFVVCVLNVKKEPRLLAGVLGIGAFCLTYHPLRWFPSALFAAMILARALSCRTR